MKIQKSVLVPYSAQQMFELVEDVAAYPSFLPWCKAVQVRQHQSDRLVATLCIGLLGKEFNLTTVNQQLPPQSMIMQLQEGPFQSLKGEWCFTPLTESACKVQFLIEYRFNNPMLEKIFGAGFKYISQGLVDQFIERARALYESP